VTRWLALLFVLGCARPTSRCIASHQYTYTVLIMVGKVMVPQTRTGTACDRRIKVDTLTGYDSLGTEWDT
jgi:hypothetical protein